MSVPRTSQPDEKRGHDGGERWRSVSPATVAHRTKPYTEGSESSESELAVARRTTPTWNRFKSLSRGGSPRLFRLQKSFERREEVGPDRAPLGRELIHGERQPPDDPELPR